MSDRISLVIASGSISSGVNEDQNKAMGELD